MTTAQRDPTELAAANVIVKCEFLPIQIVWVQIDTSLFTDDTSK